MRKIILTLIIIASFVTAHSQVLRPSNLPTTNAASRFDITGYQMDSAFLYVMRDSFPCKYPSVIYHPNGNLYKSPGGAGAYWTLITDTTWLSNRINLKLNIADTAAMLSNYLRKTDTAQMLANRLKISDTSHMLLPYHQAYYSAAFDTGSRALTLYPITGTSPTVVTIPRGGTVSGISSLTASRYNSNNVKLTGDNGSVVIFSVSDADSAQVMKYTDTASMLSHYERYSDTANQMSGYLRIGNSKNGTLTNINTTNGIIGGPITNTGTIQVDSTVYSTKAYVLKVASDTSSSLRNLINSKGVGSVSAVIAGTGMSFTTITSSGSVNADTTVLSTKANVVASLLPKLNISDTASMLSNRLKISDTATMLRNHATYAETLTGKNISGSNNNLSNIANSSLVNSTISGIPLGSNLGSLILGAGLTGGTYNGSTSITISATGGTGTVTSVTASLPLSVTNSTNSPNITIDTINSVYGATTLYRNSKKLNISDTAAMLSPYVRSSNLIGDSSIYILVTGQSNANGFNNGDGDNSIDSLVTGWAGGTTWNIVQEGILPLGQLYPLTPSSLPNSNNATWHLAKTLRKRYNRPVRVLIMGWGGNPIQNWVGYSSPNFRYIDSVMTLIGSPKLNYFIWDQGEANGTGGGIYVLNDSAYRNKWDTVISQFRSKSWFPRSTPVLAVGLFTTHGNVSVFGSIDFALQNIGAGRDPFVSYVPVNTLGSYDSSFVHRSGAGTVTEGDSSYPASLRDLGHNIVKQVDQNYLNNAVTYGPNVMQGTVVYEQANSNLYAFNNGQWSITQNITTPVTVAPIQQNNTFTMRKSYNSNYANYFVLDDSVAAHKILFGDLTPSIAEAGAFTIWTASTNNRFKIDSTGKLQWYRNGGFPSFRLSDSTYELGLTLGTPTAGYRINFYDSLDMHGNSILGKTETTGNTGNALASLDFVHNAITAAATGGTVTNVSVVTANGVSGSVSNPTTSPAITLTLGAITPTSVNASGNITATNFYGSGTSLTGVIHPSDTATQMSGYVRKNFPVLYTDSSSMLSHYFRTASNGLSYSGQNVTFGGTLTANTALQTSSYSLQFLKSQAVNNTGAQVVNGTLTLNNYTSYDNAQQNYSGVYGALGDSSATAWVTNARSIYSAANGTAYLYGSGNVTGTTPLSALSGWVLFKNGASYNNVATIHAKTPLQQTGGTFTNNVLTYSGLQIDNIRDSSDLASKIKNVYAINQMGAHDTSNFAGIISGNIINATTFNGAGTGLTGTASSLSIGGNAATASNSTLWNSLSYAGSLASSVLYIMVYDGVNNAQRVANNTQLQSFLNGTAVSASSGTFSSLGTGTVYSNSSALTNTNPSDRRLKNTINPLKYGLKEVLRLTPKSFYYNSDSAKNTLVFGLIAQDVKKVMPEIVKEDSRGMLGIKSDNIDAVLINAIKEQQKEIEELKSEIKKLKHKK